MNVVVLQGKLSRAPEARELRENVLLTYEVTTRDDDGKASTAPVVWFDPPSAWQLEADDEVTVVGEVRRRFFRSNGRTESRTEVVATAVVPSRRRAQVSRAVEGALARLEEAVT